MAKKESQRTTIGSGFSDVSAVAAGNSLLRITGPGTESLRKYLTIIDKKVVWEINRLADLLKTPRGYSQANYINGQIEALQKKKHICYWDEDTDGSTVVPAGYWYLVNYNCQSSIKPVHSSYARPYQIEAVKNAMVYKRAMIVAATGLGKSIIIQDIAHSFLRAEKNVCVIVPTIDLVGQMVSQLKKISDDVIVSGAGGTYKYKVGCHVLVSTPITAAQYIDRFDCVLIDETHHLSATTWFELGFAAKKAEYFYGLTATPIRSDNLEMGIHAWVGPVVFDRDTTWGIENNWLVPVKARMFCIDTPRISKNANSMKAYGAICKNEKVLEFIYKSTSSLLAKDHKVLLLFATIKAGEEFKKYSAKQGLLFNVAHAQFRAPFVQFKKGETNLLVGTYKLFGEGIDVPDISAVINVTNVSSEGVCRQIIGRAIRKSEGKECAFIADIAFRGYDQFMRAYFSRKSVLQSVTSDYLEAVAVK